MAVKQQGGKEENNTDLRYNYIDVAVNVVKIV